MIGVNAFQDTEESELPFSEFVIDPATTERQIARLQEVRRERDGREVTRLLTEIKRAAGTDENLMPIVADAVRAHASVGEICDVLRDVYGEFKPLSIY